MEPSLGLSTGGGGDGTAKVAVCEKNARVEKDYMGMPKGDGLELGLGLSLGGGFEYRRILTAKDFPNGFKYGIGGGGGTKRERTAAHLSPEEGSPSAAAAVSQVVGWPPIRAYRMNSLFNQAKASNVVEEDKGVGDNENNNNSKKKINHGQDKKAEPPIKERSHLGYVKVNMDGLPIGRKVDLNAHKSYETLAKMLEEMFFKPSLMIGGGKDQPVQPSKLLNGSSEFVLTYEDKEGDWMLLGDVPWGMFLDTVKRVRIMRTSEANGLTSKFQEVKSSEKPKGKPA